MADQDFDIKVRTTADTRGIKEVEAELATLEARQKALRAAFLSPIPAELQGKDVLPMSPEKAEAAGGNIAEHIGRGFQRVAIHAIGVGAVLEAINAIKQVAEEINKITDSLDKQGEMLVKNSQEIIRQSKFASDQADITKIAELGLKNIAEQHKHVEELQKKELTLAEKISDLQAKTAPGGGKGPNQARLDKQREDAADNEASARRTTIQALATASTRTARLETQSYAQSVAELTADMKEQEALADQHLLKGEIKDYLDAATAAAQYKKELDALKTAHEKSSKEAEKTFGETSPRVKGILALESLQKTQAQKGDIAGAERTARSAELMKRGLKGEEASDVTKLEKALYEQTLVLQQIRDSWK